MAGSGAITHADALLRQFLTAARNRVTQELCRRPVSVSHELTAMSLTSSIIVSSPIGEGSKPNFA